MKKFIWTIIVAVIIVVIIILATSKAKTSAVKIGVILPLTGPIASLGENSKNGALLAYQDLSKDVRNNVQLVFEDDQFDAKNTVSAFNKLVSIDHVNAIACLTSTPCAAIAPLAEEAHIPLIAVASAAVQTGKSYVFRFAVSPEAEGNKLAQYVSQKGYKNVASIVAVQDGIQAAYIALDRDSYFKDHEVVHETATPDQKDYRTSITKILAKKPDAVLVGLLPGFAGDFGKQARALGYKGDFIAFDFIEGDETIAAAQGSLNGIVYTQSASPIDWFISKYQTMYGKSFGTGSAEFYDIISILSPRLVQGAKPDDIVKYLNSIKDFNGDLGVYSTTGGHEFDLPIMMKTINAGKFVPLVSIASSTVLGN